MHIDNLIPITDAMGFAVECDPAGGIAVQVPAGPNRNDKGTAFAGSIFSALVLAPWYVLHHATVDAGVPCDIAVYRCETDFSAPARGGFTVRCDNCAEVASTTSTLAAEGVARVRMASAAYDVDGNVLASFAGHYHLRRRSAGAPGSRP